MKMIKQYLEETIVTKASQRRKISKLEKEKGELKEKLEDAKANEIDAIDRMNVMKEEFIKEHQKVKELEKEKIELEQKYEEQIRLIKKEIKNMEKQNEVKRSARTKKQISEK